MTRLDFRASVTPRKRSLSVPESKEAHRLTTEVVAAFVARPKRQTKRSLLRARKGIRGKYLQTQKRTFTVLLSDTYQGIPSLASTKWPITASSPVSNA